MSSKNIYQLLSSLNDEACEVSELPLSNPAKSTVQAISQVPKISFEDSDSDDQTQEPEYSFGKYRVNLREFERTYPWPIFTRELLRNIAELRSQVTKEKEKEILSLAYPDILGKNRIVWKAPEGNENDVAIKYATRVDLHEDFQNKMAWKFVPEAENKTPYQSSPMVELAHEYNGRSMKDIDTEWIPLPFVFENVETAVCRVHKNQKAMEEFSRTVGHATSLWINSKARTKLENRFFYASQGSAQIKKIVCIGLGSLFDNDMSCEGLLQHLAAFTIARKLHACYKTVQSECPRIKIIAQDPCYSEADRILLRGIGEIAFVSDPQAFLEIDEHTLVLTFCLPYAVPLMQILPDMFEPGKGPAALLCDTLRLDPERSLYRFRRRESPAVCQMLSPKHYRMGKFEDWTLDQNLKEYIYPVGTKKQYWLKNMTLYFRRAEKEKQI